ncbi:MAG: DUF6259 domain-containing protein [Fusicatenibacter sp.]|nr:DUF6259 domain-containing protein [Fusicatenibacter sp.]
MSYDMVTADFEGEWHDAAELYRNWMQENADMPVKLRDNINIPEWLAESPLVMIYPIRGKFSDKTNSKIMTLFMHWEGTAPWAPPYVWPPFGGEVLFRDFVDTMHKKGNLVGVYCSGIGWTVKSTLQPDFDLSDRYDESLICRTPADTIEQTRIIGDEIRYGLDMCPYDTEKVGNIASGEIISIAKSGCDYAQYFDQNLGGESSFCYAQNHGHPAGPGIWQNESMIRLFRKIRMDLDAIGSPMLLGCEGASSEPFIEYLTFNDLRYVFGFLAGNPVPAYAYLFHEYINNFTGNQDWIEGSMDPLDNPECLLFRLAYSFAAGDVLSVTLGDQGNVIWGWGVQWDKKIPGQEQIFTLIRNLNAWRRQYKEFLCLGKMVKPLELEETGDYILYLRKKIKIVYKSLLTTRWENTEGVQRQVIVNFMPYEQTCKIRCNKVYRFPEDTGTTYKGSLKVASLNAVWVE